MQKEEMIQNDLLNSLSRDQLLRLIEDYAKNWLAMDGVWFQAAERHYGMDAAMQLDAEAWQTYTVVEARRIKAFLQLPEQPGLEGLERALRLRFYASINRDEIRWEPGRKAFTYRTLDCRVQTARRRKGMPLHPCKPVGAVEYSGFARTIDPRIRCQCLSCYPDIEDAACACAWRFHIEDEQPLTTPTDL